MVSTGQAQHLEPQFLHHNVLGWYGMGIFGLLQVIQIIVSHIHMMVLPGMRHHLEVQCMMVLHGLLQHQAIRFSRQMVMLLHLVVSF